MLDELPMCHKCCCCIPLRYGLLTWMYMKLFLASFIMTILIVILNEFHIYLDEFVSFVIIILLVVIIDIILSIIFIFGGHMKNVKLLQTFYYYSIVMAGAAILPAVVSGGLMVAILPHFSVVLLISITSSALSLVIQTYFLLLLRTEIIKLRSNCPYRFVKSIGDSEDTIQPEKPAGDGGTAHIYEKEIS